jgi:hypothetical protein
MLFRSGILPILPLPPEETYPAVLDRCSNWESKCCGWDRLPHRSNERMGTKPTVTAWFGLFEMIESRHQDSIVQVFVTVYRDARIREEMELRESRSFIAG